MGKHKCVEKSNKCKCFYTSQKVLLNGVNHRAGIKSLILILQILLMYRTFITFTVFWVRVKPTSQVDSSSQLLHNEPLPITPLSGCMDHWQSTTPAHVRPSTGSACAQRVLRLPSSQTASTQDEGLVRFCAAELGGIQKLYGLWRCAKACTCDSLVLSKWFCQKTNLSSHISPRGHSQQAGNTTQFSLCEIVNKNC